jgi:hypothetical protein
LTAKEIWTSQPEFQKYPLDDFKRYNKNMKILVSNKIVRAATEETIVQEDMKNHRHKQRTFRGTLFWGEHAAKLSRMSKMALAEQLRHRSYGNQGKSTKPFPMNSFVSVSMRLGRRHLLHHTGRSKEKNGREQQRLKTNRMREEWTMDVEIEKMTDI